MSTKLITGLKSMDALSECQGCFDFFPLKDLNLDERNDNLLYCDSCFENRDRERTEEQKDYFVSEVLWELVLTVEDNELYEELEGAN